LKDLLASCHSYFLSFQTEICSKKAIAEFYSGLLQRCRSGEGSPKGVPRQETGPMPALS
jgi:hypothetical protein